MDKKFVCTGIKPAALHICQTLTLSHFVAATIPYVTFHRRLPFLLKSKNHHDATTVAPAVGEAKNVENRRRDGVSPCSNAPRPPHSFVLFAIVHIMVSRDDRQWMSSSAALTTNAIVANLCHCRCLPPLVPPLLG